MPFTVILATWVAGFVPAGSESPNAAVDSAAGPVVLQVSKAQDAEYASIQSAIDAAPAGAVIRVASGVYGERLLIRKPITLAGAGWQQTTVAVPKRKSDKIELRAAARQFEQKHRSAETDAEKKAIIETFMDEYGPYAVSIRDARDVKLQGLKITAGVSRKGTGLLSGALVTLRRCELRMSDCAVVGSPGDGLWIVDGVQVEIRDCLVAAAWGTGIVVGERGEGPTVRATVVDCDVRNCHYAGITIRAGNAATVQGCRVWGAAWHGVRYDDTSPTIVGNRIFANARCGIYASGNTAATVKGNLFCNGEGSGVWCLFENHDTIAENTFADNARIGLGVSGAARPAVERNIFSDHPMAISCSFLNDKRASAEEVGAPRLKGNLFWNNQMDLARYVPKEDDTQNPEPQQVEPGEQTATVRFDPRFADAPAGDFSLMAGSVARRDRMGVADPLGEKSPWPLQPEELAIIPDGPTRDSRAWRQPPDDSADRVVPEAPY